MNRRIRLTILTSAAVFTRLFLLGRKSLWIDECLAWGASRMEWMDMLNAVSSGTPHPPLSFVLIKLSTLAAGSGEIGLRLFIALVTASAVIPVYRLASRRISEEGGFMAALLWAVAPYSVSLGQECWVYGLNAALSLWFADSADLAWRGSQKAYISAVFLGILGLMSQHIFLLSIMMASVLYFSVPSRERIPFLKFLVLLLFLALVYLPVFLRFREQFAARHHRMVSAGAQIGLERLFSLRPVSEFLRIIPGGILPVLSANLLERPRMLSAYFVNIAVVFSTVILPLLFWRKWKLPGLRFLLPALVIPFVLFIGDDPTARQMAVLWIPVSISSAGLFLRFRWTGPAVLILCCAALVPYYHMKEFPYHRSNWREAVHYVDSIASPGQEVIIFGGKSTALAWEYYSSSDIPIHAHRGRDPFAPDSVRADVSPSDYLEEVLENSRGDVWIINDIWRAPISGLIDGFNVCEYRKKGEMMETGLVKRHAIVFSLYD